MSVWVLTQVTENEEIVQFPTLVLGVYRSLADAQKAMKQVIQKLSEQDWAEVPAEQTKIPPTLPNPYHGMKLEKIVRTVLTDGGEICALQLTCLPIQ